ncbi:hypothetical protein Bca52824_026915 [Brassica carinata]|uniref:Uncharacterized protein n=1 Tax=Brassica carinata TaxID=52824 RepID=A0A8X7SJD6_BRACI|nr:hypothetical protein Bca52824_026915 [Brassica carinata]
MGASVHKDRHLSDLGGKGGLLVLRLVEGGNRATTLAKIANEFLSVLKTLEFGGKQSGPPLHLCNNRPPSFPLRANKGPRMELSLCLALFLDLLPKPKEFPLSLLGFKPSATTFRLDSSFSDS